MSRTQDKIDLLEWLTPTQDPRKHHTEPRKGYTDQRKERIFLLLESDYFLVLAELISSIKEHTSIP